MHPVKIDELLMRTDGSEPIKHDDSPFVWIETYYENNRLVCYLPYFASGEYVEPTEQEEFNRRRPLAGGFENVSLFYHNELTLLRGLLSKYPNWKP